MGLLLTAVGLNALGEWSQWQFVGLFGVVEMGSGIANVITPNLWAMPVVEQETSKRTQTVLALDTLLIPHWGGLARSVAGLAMIGAAGWHEGFGPATSLLVPLCLAIAALQLGLSALTARAGVALHKYDVVGVTLNWFKEIRVPPISLSASALQFVLNLITIPAMSVLSPGALYQPEIGPSVGGLNILTAVTIAAAAGGLLAWWGRIARRAPREQRVETEAQV